MRLPRDLDGQALAALLRRYGYAPTRQTGSHMRLTTYRSGEHHITIPCGGILRIGTLAAILKEVAEHFGMEREALSRSLFGD